MSGDKPMGGSGAVPPDARPEPARELLAPSAPRASQSGDSSGINGTNANRNASGTLRLCKKCGDPLTGQFVRALGGTFHLDCFKCQDCGQIVASKFFPVDDESGTGQYPLCETDYFRRLDLLCFDCGGALRGSYITALERKYHIEHFRCSVCPTVFGAQDSYYEHEGKVFCHYHYSTRFAERCSGCQTAILKQFVEIFRNGVNQHWHPECYMIHKFWNVRLSTSDHPGNARPSIDRAATEEERIAVRVDEERMEEKVYRIWSILSTFEESSASCISDMLLNVSNGAYMDGVTTAKKFIWHVELLFAAADRLDQMMIFQGMKGLSYGREAKLLCKKIVAFFSLLAKTSDTGVRKLGVTQELLSLVTGLAHYLKLLIRISLQGALRSERERKTVEGLHRFLDELSDLTSLKEADKSLDATAGVSGLAEKDSDACTSCKKPIEDECAVLGENRWHRSCMACSNCGSDLTKSINDARWARNERRLLCPICTARGYPHATNGFALVSRLQQYIFLLRVSLARLLVQLRTGGSLPHTSDDPNISEYKAQEGHKLPVPSEGDPPLLRSNTRSKSYGGAQEEESESSYAQTLGDIKRLRSTRMDKHLSTSMRKARTSRIIDGPESSSVRPGSSGAGGADQGRHDFHIIEDRDQVGQGGVTDLKNLANQEALTLDDIPRIIAAEKAKEQRPNAYKHARSSTYGPLNAMPGLSNGHQRSASGGNELDHAATSDMPAQRNKTYFSELTALEYFIVRHVAVMSMAPLVEKFFNLEELLGLIEQRKTTFWGKFGNVFKNDNKKTKKKGTFGVDLVTLAEKEGAESTYGVGPGALRVPAIIDDAVTAMRQMDMSVEGVFRKNGNIKRLKEAESEIDAKGNDSVDMSKENPVQVAALLKRFLRSLPDPLLTFKLHRLFICSQQITDENVRKRVLHLSCCLLPKPHRDSMEIIFSFLNWCASFAHIDEESGSKMDIHNLATVITPNILYSGGKSSGMDDSFLAIEAVHTLIDCNEAMCEIPEDLQTALTDPTLFNGSGEITTKEILKRYGDVAKLPVPSRGGPAETSAMSKESRSTTPAYTHVETEVSQENTWNERSVRPVPAGTQPVNGSHSQQGTPMQSFEFINPPSLFRERTGSSGSQDSRGQASQTSRNSQYRTPGWTNQKPPPGATGGGPGGPTGLNGQ
ncbi:MAG: hypothetical protein M1814_004012 [Vezdaea aestivalis]|nr:MAG: hypothetical protein M1814_004012 [Vezdaea aestivalis]